MRTIERAFEEVKARRAMSDREAFKLGLTDTKNKNKQKFTYE